MGGGLLMKQEVDRIVLTRPAVEAGEKLGFFQGHRREGQSYLRPLYDALHDMMEFERLPVGRARGDRSRSSCLYARKDPQRLFVILDEAQNTGSDQMKMFLTRLGFHSKAVITGDITQVISRK